MRDLATRRATLPSSQLHVPSLLFVLGCASFFPFRALFQVGSINDEGIVSVGATRLLAGEAIYTDFFTHFAPGTYFLTLLAYAVMGPTIAATRLLAALITGGLALSVFLISRRVLPGKWAFIPYLLFVCSGVTQWPILSYHWAGVLTFLLGTLALLRWREAPEEWSRGVLCGVTCALANWTLQSESAALYLLTLLVAAVYHRQISRRMLLAWIVGLVVTSGILWAPILVRTTIADIWQQNVEWALGNNAGNGTSPYTPSSVLNNWASFFQQLKATPLSPGVANWILHTVSYLLTWSCNYLLFYPVFFVAALLAYRSRPNPNLTIIVLAQTTSILAWSSRQTMLYLNFLTPLFFILLAWLLCRYKTRAVAIFLCLVYATSYLYQCVEASRFIFPIQTVRGTLYTSDPQLASAYNELFRTSLELTPLGSPAFCYPYAMGFTFLSGVSPIGRLSSVIPVLGETDQVPSLVVELERRQLPYIYHFGWSPETLSAVPNIDKDHFWGMVRELDQEILKDYIPLKDFGFATVYKRRPDS